MMARALHGWLLPASSLAIVLGLGAGDVLTQSSNKTIFVSVIDGEGKPVTDMTAADFALREDTIDREIVSATLSTQPLYVTMLVDTTDGAEEYVQDLRAGFKGFVEELMTRSPQSQVALWEFGQAALRIKDFTNDAAAMQKEVARIFPKPKAPSVLLEALYATSEALSKVPSPRRAIVALNLEPGDEQSAQQPKKINESLMKSRAQVWSLSVQKGALKNAPRDVVLNTLVRNAGGRREYIVTQQAIEGYLRLYAAGLAAQYELTYARPAGKPQVVQTGARRPGVKVIAGIFAPQ